MKDRVRQVMTWAKLSQQDFATYLEISPASLSSIFNGRTNPTNNHVQAIHRAFPEINVSWLMFGEGEMLLNGKSQEEGPSVVSSQKVTSDISDSVEIDMGVAPSFFTESEFMSASKTEKVSNNSNVNLQDTLRQAALLSSVNKNAKNFDILKRNIKEIRVFFDDGTYESFVPSTGK
jgi:transcriptional regulator with XRE-family HTH domain